MQNLCGPVSLEGLMPTTQKVCPDEGQHSAWQAEAIVGESLFGDGGVRRPGHKLQELSRALCIVRHGVRLTDSNRNEKQSPPQVCWTASCPVYTPCPLFTAAWCPGLEITDAARNAGTHYPHSRRKTGLRRSWGYFGQLGFHPSVVWSHHVLPEPRNLALPGLRCGVASRSGWVLLQQAQTPGKSGCRA